MNPTRRRARFSSTLPAAVTVVALAGLIGLVGLAGPASAADSEAGPTRTEDRGYCTIYPVTITYGNLINVTTPRITIPC